MEKDSPVEQVMTVQDIASDEKSPLVKAEGDFPAEAAEQDGFNMAIVDSSAPDDHGYHAAAMRTAAGPEVFYPGNARPHDVAYYLARFIIMARHLDAFKSALFYGKVKHVEINDLAGLLASGGTDGHFDFDHIANPQLLHACLGITSEAGEIAEDLLKALQGQLLSTENLVRESGDIDWFQELLATATETPVNVARAFNVARLRQRFPDAFSEADAIARADEE